MDTQTAPFSLEERRAAARKLEATNNHNIKNLHRLYLIEIAESIRTQYPQVDSFYLQESIASSEEFVMADAADADGTPIDECILDDINDSILRHHALDNYTAVLDQQLTIAEAIAFRPKPFTEDEAPGEAPTETIEKPSTEVTHAPQADLTLDFTIKYIGDYTGRVSVNSEDLTAWMELQDRDALDGFDLQTYLTARGIEHERYNRDHSGDEVWSNLMSPNNTGGIEIEEN